MRFESEVYEPETTKLMKDAFEAALRQVRAVENDSALTQKLLASAIVDQVSAGLRDRETIVARAVAILTVARNLPG